jgi:predicted ABC-type transport system involved in lysophospholipase L1 biosynthesis ATPase subunit
MNATQSPVIFLHQVERQYRQGDVALDILNGADLAVWSGQMVALLAPSGAGKSTLLHIAGLLEHQDSGEVFIDDVPTSTLTDAERTRIRRNEIGFIYQAHHLLNEFTAVENVMLPQMIRGLSRKDAAEGAPAPSAGGIVGRRAAARGDRARGRQRAAHPARRRADRQSRPAHLRARVSRAHPARARLAARRRHRDP